MIQRITPQPGSRVIKLVRSAPSEPWFNRTEWSKLPVGSELRVERVDEKPDLGGTVIQMEPTSATDGAIFFIPATWFNTGNFRKVNSLSGQQNIEFIEPDFSRH